MTFTPSDIADLSTSLSRWETAEYIFAGLVAVACFGEYVASFTNWFTGGIEERKKGLEKGATLLLVAALALELVCLVRTNQLSGVVIGSINEEAGEADAKAKAAITDSSTALSQASNALTLARDARKEADSFEKDIVSAKNKAAAVEERLADRGFTTEQQTKLAAALSKLTQFPITFNSVIGNNEAERYARKNTSSLFQVARNDKLRT
jgi:hypothetical protein